MCVARVEIVPGVAGDQAKQENAPYSANTLRKSDNTGYDKPVYESTSEDHTHSAIQYLL